MMKGLAPQTVVEILLLLCAIIVILLLFSPLLRVVTQIFAYFVNWIVKFLLCVVTFGIVC
jgi:hypothetical protein